MLIAKVNIIHQGQTEGHGKQVKEVVVPSKYNHDLKQNLGKKIVILILNKPMKVRPVFRKLNMQKSKSMGNYMQLLK